MPLLVDATDCNCEHTQLPRWVTTSTGNYVHTVLSECLGVDRRAVKGIRGGIAGRLLVCYSARLYARLSTRLRSTPGRCLWRCSGAALLGRHHGPGRSIYLDTGHDSDRRCLTREAIHRAGPSVRVCTSFLKFKHKFPSPGLQGSLAGSDTGSEDTRHRAGSLRQEREARA